MKYSCAGVLLKMHSGLGRPPCISSFVFFLSLYSTLFCSFLLHVSSFSKNASSINLISVRGKHIVCRSFTPLIFQNQNLPVWVCLSTLEFPRGLPALGQPLGHSGSCGRPFGDGKREEGSKNCAAYLVSSRCSWNKFCHPRQGQGRVFPFPSALALLPDRILRWLFPGLCSCPRQLLSTDHTMGTIQKEHTTQTVIRVVRKGPAPEAAAGIECL